MFAYLPLLIFASVGFFLTEPVVMFGAANLSLVLLIIATVCRKYNWIFGLGQLLLFGLIVIYLISMIQNEVLPTQGFTGNYGRNFGIWYFISIAILYAFSTTDVNGLNRFEPSLLILLGLSLVYGTVQFFDIDPFPWTNRFDAVQLTLGNPNFAGALLGMLFVVPVVKFIYSKTVLEKLFSAVVVIWHIQIILATKSLQSIVISSLSLLIAVFILRQQLNQGIWRHPRPFLIFGAMCMFVILTLVFLLEDERYKVFKNELYIQGSIPQRLDYWRTGIAIFKDNFFLGVGPDQFQRYAAQYRTSIQVVRDGEFSIPDRAHNILIDHLANGGIIAGIIWASFCLYIFWNLFVAAKCEISKVNRIRLSILGGVWGGYFVQSLLSPDHVLLSVIGVMSAGFIVQAKRGNTLSAIRSSRISFLTDKFFFRIIFGSILLFAIVFWTQVLNTNLSTKKVLEMREIDQQIILNSVNTWNPSALNELILYSTLKNSSNCTFASDLAKKTLKYSVRSSQSWYILSLCEYQRKNFQAALDLIDLSLEIDPINPFYLVAKAKLAIAAGNKSEGMSVLDILKREYPDNPEISLIESSLSFL